MSNSLQFIGTRYVLAVKNLAKSVNYYIEQLGFSSAWDTDGWHALERGKISLMLGECPNERSAYQIGDHSYFAYIDLLHIDSLYEELQAKDVEIIKELQDEPWGQREFGIRTIDGHRIMFGETL